MYEDKIYTLEEKQSQKNLAILLPFQFKFDSNIIEYGTLSDH